MNDLIRREDAIHALTEVNLKNHMDSVEDGGQENRSAIRIIMALPSVNQWIPCSDHNPKLNGSYLVTKALWGAWEIDRDVRLDDHWVRDDKVIAWMPLPKPWEGEEEWTIDY